VKFKLDESIGRRGLELLEASGHDAMTVRDQGLRGVTDEELFEICSAEGRTLLTLDRDFGHVLRFPPEKSAGIVILEVGPRTTLQGILARLRDFLAVLDNCSVAGALWIVEPGSATASAAEPLIRLPLIRSHSILAPHAALMRQRPPSRRVV
jgi:predicted nuclease of predicted toxin-antitoxin system